jgi:hypothetical protein
MGVAAAYQSGGIGGAGIEKLASARSAALAARRVAWRKHQWRSGGVFASRSWRAVAAHRNVAAQLGGWNGGNVGGNAWRIAAKAASAAAALSWRRKAAARTASVSSARGARQTAQTIGA